MAQEFSRTRRVGQQLKKELALILQREFRDPRVGMVTVSDVEVSRDLAYAKVFFTVLGVDDEKVALNTLNEASGYIRTLLGQRMKMRLTPELRFFFDKTLTEGMRISNLVSDAVREDERRRKASGEDKEES